VTVVANLYYNVGLSVVSMMCFSALLFISLNQKTYFIALSTYMSYNCGTSKYSSTLPFIIISATDESSMFNIRNDEIRILLLTYSSQANANLLECNSLSKPIY